MRIPLLPPLLLALAATGCANVGYTTVKRVELPPDGGNRVEVTTTHFRSASLLSTTAVKGIVVDGNGGHRDAPGLRLTGAATDPNSQAITASADALGALIGAAAATAAKGAK